MSEAIKIGQYQVVCDSRHADMEMFSSLLTAVEVKALCADYWQGLDDKFTYSVVEIAAKYNLACSEVWRVAHDNTYVRWYVRCAYCGVEIESGAMTRSKFLKQRSRAGSTICCGACRGKLKPTPVISRPAPAPSAAEMKEQARCDHKQKVLDTLGPEAYRQGVHLKLLPAEILILGALSDLIAPEQTHDAYQRVGVDSQSGDQAFKKFCDLNLIGTCAHGFSFPPGAKELIPRLVVPKSDAVLRLTDADREMFRQMGISRD